MTDTRELGAPDSGPSARRASTRKTLLVILVLGSLLRAALLGWFAGKPLEIFDERDYDDTAVNLVETGQFALDTGVPSAHRPPGYPVLVAAVYAVTGVKNYQAVRLFQALLALLTVGLVFLLVKRLYGESVAVVAAAIYCFYPTLLIYTNFLLTESIVATIFCAICLIVARYLDRPSVLAGIGLGVALGLGALTRSVLWLFPPFLVVFLFFSFRDSKPGRRVLLATLPAVLCALTLVPWAARNTRIEKTFTLIDTMGGRNFMMGNYEHTPMYRSWATTQVRGDRAWVTYMKKDHPDWRQLTNGQRDRLAMRRAVRFALAHPVLTAQRSIVKFFNFWQLERSVIAGLAQGWWGDVSRVTLMGVAVVVLGGWTVMMLSAVFGFVTLPPDNRRLHWFILLCIAFLCAAHSATFAHSRYHLPLIPLLVGYSANALMNWRLIWERRRSRAFLVALAIALVLIASWTVELVFEATHRGGAAIS